MYTDVILSASKEMNEAVVASPAFTTSESPCSPHEVAIRPDDCVEGGVEKWLEDEAVAGFRVWQLAGIILSILLSLLIGICCCIRFRVPRTKQEIEADYIRKKITKNFRHELSKISNVEMDQMDLSTALHRVQRNFNTEDRRNQMGYQERIRTGLEQGLRSRVNAIFSGIHVRFVKKEHAGFDNMI